MLSPRKKKKNRKTLRSVMLTLGILGIGAASYAGYLIHKADKALEQMSVSAAASAQQSTGEKAAEIKPMSFLLVGVDNRKGSGGSMNSDVMMLVSLNPETRSATMVSIPRDMQLKPREFGLSSQKANYYYAYYYNKDRDTALANTKQFFSSMFDVPIDYMAVIDFDGFRQVIDELDGIEVDVDMDMRYVDNFDGTNINLRKGLQTLDGKETLDFLRYRKSNRGTQESSDIARNERQQQVISKLLDRMTSFSGITQWGGMLEIAGRNVQTDIPADQLRKFILSFQKLKPDHIESIPLDGRWDSPYIVPKEDDLSAAIASLRTQLGLPSESTVTGSTYGTLSKRFGIDPVRRDQSTSQSTNNRPPR